MAALNQDFVTYAGDDVSPVFTVQTTAGVAVDISSVAESETGRSLMPPNERTSA